MHSAGWTSLHVIMLSSIQLNHFRYSSTSFFEVWVVVVVDFLVSMQWAKAWISWQGLFAYLWGVLTLPGSKFILYISSSSFLTICESINLMGFFFSGGRCWLPRLIWSLLAGDGFVYSEKKKVHFGFSFYQTLLCSFCCKSLFSLFHAFCDGPSYFVFFCDVSVVHCSMQLLSSEFSFFLYRYPHGYCYAY